MLSQKTDKNKNLILEIILVIIVLVITFFVFKSFLFKNKSLSKKENQFDSFSKPENFKPLDTSVFKDDKFKSLKNNNAKRVKLDDLNIGRINPFMEADN